MSRGREWFRQGPSATDTGTLLSLLPLLLDSPEWDLEVFVCHVAFGALAITLGQASHICQATAIWRKTESYTKRPAHVPSGPGALTLALVIHFCNLWDSPVLSLFMCKIVIIFC